MGSSNTHGEALCLVLTHMLGPTTQCLTIPRILMGRMKPDWTAHEKGPATTCAPGYAEREDWGEMDHSPLAVLNIRLYVRLPVARRFAKSAGHDRVIAVGGFFRLTKHGYCCIIVVIQ